MARLEMNYQQYLVTLMLPVLFADTTHERTGLTALFQTNKLNGMHLVLGAHGLLVGLISQGHTPVLGQSLGGVSELGAVCTQVGGTDSAVHGRHVGLVLVTTDDTLTMENRQN